MRTVVPWAGALVVLLWVQLCFCISILSVGDTKQLDNQEASEEHSGLNSYLSVNGVLMIEVTLGTLTYGSEF